MPFLGTSDERFRFQPERHSLIQAARPAGQVDVISRYRRLRIRRGVASLTGTPAFDDAASGTSVLRFDCGV
jgi:hypothetical protein